jgi:chemotaxis protein MotA
MDILLILGILGALGSLVGMALLEGAHLQSLYMPAPVLIVVGGTIFAGMAGSTVPDLIAHAKAIPSYFTGKFPKPGETVERFVDLAIMARKGGLLTLEAEVGKNGDTFMDLAVQGIADSMQEEDLRDLLEEKSDTLTETEMASSHFYSQLGGYAPTIGIVGTVVSLVHVLGNLDKPDELGHMIAAAFIATMWGLMTANFFWHPIATRARRLSELAAMHRALVTEGAILLLSGSAPSEVRSRLTAIVPTHLMPKTKSKK